MAIIGKRNLLSVIRQSQPGLYLDGGELGEILFPGRYIPADFAPKQKLNVFVYRDSEDRLVATTETPNAMVGEFACMIPGGTTPPYPVRVPGRARFTPVALCLLEQRPIQPAY